MKRSNDSSSTQIQIDFYAAERARAAVSRVCVCCKAGKHQSRCVRIDLNSNNISLHANQCINSHTIGINLVFPLHFASMQYWRSNRAQINGFRLHSNSILHFTFCSKHTKFYANASLAIILFFPFFSFIFFVSLTLFLSNDTIYRLVCSSSLSTERWWEMRQPIKCDAIVNDFDLLTWIKFQIRYLFYKLHRLYRLRWVLYQTILK